MISLDMSRTDNYAHVDVTHYPTNPLAEGGGLLLGVTQFPEKYHHEYVLHHPAKPCAERISRRRVCRRIWRSSGVYVKNAVYITVAVLSDMHSNHLKIAILSALVIIAIQVAIGAAAYYWLPDWQVRGQFGDVFGAANALFSGLAFAGLIYAILLQREDLELQRKELEMTRQELTRSAQAQEQSEIALRAQAEAASQSARLNATNFLLDHYRSELVAMRNIALMANDPRLGRMQELERRVQVLVAVLDGMFTELSNEGRQ